MSLSDDLESLAKLYAQGSLSEAEYVAAKAKLIGPQQGLSSAPSSFTAAPTQPTSGSPPRQGAKTSRVLIAVGLLVCAWFFSRVIREHQRSQSQRQPAGFDQLDHFGVFVRNGPRWLELERLTPNFNYGNVVLTTSRAFNGVTSQTGPSVSRAPFEVVIYGQQECEGVGAYEVNVVDRVGDVSPPSPGIACVESQHRLVDMRRGPVQGHQGMCRIWSEPSTRLPVGQFFVKTTLGYYFFRTEGPASTVRSGGTEVPTPQANAVPPACVRRPDGKIPCTRTCYEAHHIQVEDVNGFFIGEEEDGRCFSD